MKFETLVIHGGYTPVPPARAVAVPIYQTASFTFDDTQYAEDLFNLNVEGGNIYSRIRNPTNDVLEQRVAALEGGVGALAVSSGQAAVVCAIMNLAVSGDNIVSASELYGGSHNLFTQVFPDYGINVRFATDLRTDGFAKLIDRNTKAVFCESISNPAGNVADIEALANVAHAYGIPLIVDNSVASPYLCRPFQYGADIVVHSLTKYLGGHGNIIGGIIVDSGKFPWMEHKERFRGITAPDASYQGLVYPERFGAAAYIARARTVILRNIGSCLAPFNSFLALQGIETLPIRMDRICENTLEIAKFLTNHKQVRWVRYAGLVDHPNKPLVDKYMGGRASGIMSFGIKGGREVAGRFYDSLKLIMRMANIGDTRSLAICPASTTHRQLSAKDHLAAGVTDDMIRLSIGLEHVDDLVEDLEQALGFTK